MSSPNPLPCCPQRVTKPSQKLIDPNNVGEHEAYSLNTIAQPSGTNHATQPTTQPSIITPNVPSSLPQTRNDHEEFSEPPATPPPPSSLIAIPSDLSDLEKAGSDHDTSSGSESEDGSKTSKKHKRTMKGCKGMIVPSSPNTD